MAAEAVRKHIPWKTGSYQSDTGSLGNSVAGHEAFGAWRGRPDQVVVYFITGPTWQRLTTSNLYSLYKNTKYGDNASVVAIGFFPYDNTSTLAAAARGDYDNYYSEIGRKLVEGGLSNCYLRLAWEMNGGYQWQGTKDAQHAADYRTAWQRMVTRIRQAGWRGKTVFCTQVLQQLGTVGPDMCYPGDEYVDVIGPDWYDQGPPGDPVARFNERRDGLYGGWWLADFCRAGAQRLDSSPGAGVLTTATDAKTYCVPEWALRNPDYPEANGGPTRGSGGDSPYFIRAMFEFLMEVEESGVHVEFEAYFNKDNSPTEAHKLVQGAYPFPEAAREYQRLFGGG